MAEDPKETCIIKIRTLSPPLDLSTEPPSPLLRPAIRTYLRVTAANPKCLGVYWMINEKKREEIIVISKWKDDTDKAESESYVSDPEPHTLLPILADLCVEDDKNRFARFYKCSLTAIYFPAGTSTEDLKAKVQTRAKKLIDTIQPHAGMPPPVGSVTSAWSTKPYEMNEQAMDTLLICTCTPSNKKTDEQVQLERQAWNDFLEDIKSFGYTSTDERHGFLQEYRNHSKYVFEEDTDEDDDEIDANLDHTSGAVARLRTLAEKMGGEVGQDDIIERINRMTTCCCGIDDHIPMSKARLDRIR